MTLDLIPIPGEDDLIGDLHDRAMLVTPDALDIADRIADATHPTTPNRIAHIEAVTLVALHAKGLRR